MRWATGWPGANTPKTPQASFGVSSSIDGFGSGAVGLIDARGTLLTVQLAIGRARTENLGKAAGEHRFDLCQRQIDQALDN